MVLFPIAIVSSLFPKIIKLREVSVEQYYERLQFLYDILVAISVSIALFVTLFSDFIIDLFYTKDYITASSVIKVYAWVSVFYF